MMGQCVAEFIVSNAVLATQPLENSANELDNNGVFVEVAWGYILLPAWTILCGSALFYDNERIFNWLMGAMRVPLDVFECIHICGKQLASIFYDTSEDIEEPSIPEDVMQDSDH